VRVKSGPTFLVAKERLALAPRHDELTGADVFLKPRMRPVLEADLDPALAPNDVEQLHLQQRLSGKALFAVRIELPDPQRMGLHVTDARRPRVSAQRLRMTPRTSA
jgi:hypothetical protein